MYALYYTVMYIWDYIVYFFSKCASFERCWVKNKKYNICNFLISCKSHVGDSIMKVWRQNLVTPGVKFKVKSKVKRSLLVL